MEGGKASQSVECVQGSGQCCHIYHNYGILTITLGLIPYTIIKFNGIAKYHNSEVFRFLKNLLYLSTAHSSFEFQIQRGIEKI